VAAGSRKGTSAFVCGPKKVGKTSLVLAFQRQLEAGQRGPCLTVHLEAAGGEPWSRYSRRFARKLFEAASTMVPDRMKAVADPELKRHGLTEFVCEVRRRIGVPLVLALDEAVELCLASQTAGEAEEVLQFNASMAAEAGVMVVWVGPTAALRLLDQGPREMLRDGHRLFVQPLDRSAVSALLRAEKLRSKYAIHADRTVVEMIYRTTFGNPYWTQAIADTMWREKALEGTELVVYDEGLAKKGIERTQRTDEFFADRYDVWTAEENLMARAILVALARQFRGKRTKKRGFSAAEILTFVRQAGLEPTGAELELMLRVLVDTGAIVEEIHRGAYRWLIAVPLFAQHVLAKLDAVTETTAGV
jgi:GTPase SAR1 family protein